MRKLFILLAVICGVALLPFLGLTYFNTKGEPREAVVAVSMLESGNWILPTNNGGDMAYKPPFFHWCIAVVSSLTGGKVTEFASRFPSAIGLVALTLATFLFYRPRRQVEGSVSLANVPMLTAFLTPLVMITTFEVHRAGALCRVDMVLMVCMVLALYTLHSMVSHLERSGVTRAVAGRAALAIILLACGTLTKGPVALALPCLVAWLYGLMRGVKWLKLSALLAVIGAVALALASLWYIAAYGQGGEAFLSLVMEENVGRLLGKMSYESHVNPWHYNVVTVVAGLVPYTVLCLLVLFVLPWRAVWSGFMANASARKAWTEVRQWPRRMSGIGLYSTLSIVVIFVFYCIPKSKRSVYLLPIYPFLAYWLTRLLIWTWQQRGGIFRGFTWFVMGLGSLVSIVFIALRSGLVPLSPEMFHGRHALDNFLMADALANEPICLIRWLVVLVPLAMMIACLVWRRRMALSPLHTVAAALAIYLALDNTIQPLVLNTKSERPESAEIARIVPEGPIYSYCSVEMMRYFVMNFYVGNRIQPYCLSPRELAISAAVVLDNDQQKTRPREGYIIVNNGDVEELQTLRPELSLTPVYEPGRRGWKLYKFVVIQ